MIMISKVLSLWSVDSSSSSSSTDLHFYDDIVRWRGQLGTFATNSVSSVLPYFRLLVWKQKGEISTEQEKEEDDAKKKMPVAIESRKTR